MKSIREKFGEDTSDEALAFIEDVNDTLSDYETRTADTTNWKEKYEQNDADWRKKYRDRFFSGGSETDDTVDDPEPPAMKTYEDLFKED